jgi:hypothetical protein
VWFTYEKSKWCCQRRAQQAKPRKCASASSLLLDQGPQEARHSRRSLQVSRGLAHAATDLPLYLSRTQNCYYQGHTATAAAAAELPQKMTQNSWRRGNTEDFCLVGCSEQHRRVRSPFNSTRCIYNTDLAQLEVVWVDLTQMRAGLNCTSESSGGRRRRVRVFCVEQRKATTKGFQSNSQSILKSVTEFVNCQRIR